MSDDCWLGGKDNFAVDREQAELSPELCPSLRQWARDNRSFVCGAAARAVHEAVRSVDPAARVAYVDFDGVAVTHARADGRVFAFHVGAAGQGSLRRMNKPDGPRLLAGAGRRSL